jgi:phosphonate transport system substrate-binding protein
VNVFMAYESLLKALGRDVDRSAGLDVCLPLAVEPSLRGGFYDVAIVSPVQYGAFRAPRDIKVLAAAAEGKDARPRLAVLVVKADAEIDTVDQLRGKSVAFGRAGDVHTHHAALSLLKAHGVRALDLSLELLPVPGSLKHLAEPTAVVQSVLGGKSAAGFLDEAAWEQLPEKSGSDGGPARDQLKIIARTPALPDRLLLCSPKLDKGVAEKTQAFLLTAKEKHPEALRPLNCAGYYRAEPELLEACVRLFGSAQPTSSPAQPD